MRQACSAHPSGNDVDLAVHVARFSALQSDLAGDKMRTDRLRTTLRDVIQLSPPPIDTRQNHLAPEQLQQFERDGYVILSRVAPPAVVDRMLHATLADVEHLAEPIEFEADLHYPGSPDSRDAAGGRTVRRLKQAHARGYVFTEWLTYPGVIGPLTQLLGPEIVCPLAHHNCVMTKHPAFSSDTGWHQDIRYWSFERPELITVWLALGPERPENGCLRVIPGSHRMSLERSRFDEELFFRADLADNAELIAQAVPVELDPGDVLFFHCRTLHAATRNFSTQTKYSVVFTFRAADNPPRPGTRSAESPELLIHAPAG
jgi:phytanoyl-CoA hydroxylase